MIRRPRDDDSDLDTVIVGGGPAGLTAALWLAHLGRSVRLFDAGRPRNLPARRIHGFPGLPEISPAELHARIADHARRAGARIDLGVVCAIHGEKDDFAVETAHGEVVAARRILLAYGCSDRLPEIPGLREAFGTSVFHCPDCDGPTLRGEDVAVIGHDHRAAELALYLLSWSRRVTLLTDGHAPDLDAPVLALLHRCRVAVRTRRIARIVQHHGRIRHIELVDGLRLAIPFLFVHLGSSPASDLAARLGCESNVSGSILTRDGQQTSVPGIYAAGDLSGHPHLAVSAAADGARAALAIHRSLLPPEFELGRARRP